MDIEYSYNCSLDSLKIYDVKPNGNTQLAMFCNGKDTSKHIVATTSNSMLVVFKTDHSVQGRGFSGYYRSFAYNATITEPRRGYIASPGYPLKYPANSYFSWTITGTPGSFISLIILNLSIENTFEHINIYDGDNINTRTLAHMDSNSVSQPVFMSTGSSLHIVFRSDSSYEYSGLLASYEINECQTILTGTSGDIVSPGYPLNYVENLSCSWTVITDPNTIIFLRIKDIYLNGQLDCTFDHLEIYDGRDINSPLLGTFCYPMSTATLVSTSNTLHIVMKTDGSRNYKGFRATYNSVDLPLAAVCNSSSTCVQHPVSLLASCVCPDNYYYNSSTQTCSEALGETSVCDTRVPRMCRREPHLECRPDTMGVTRCLCTSGSLYNGTHCLPYSILRVVLTSSPQIQTREVALNWAIGTQAQPVTYNITWVATEDGGDGGEIVAGPSGVHVQGLTPGTEYNFTVVSIIQGLDYYKDIIVTTNFTVETMPAPPGKLNESSSNLHSIPYVLRFEPSEGRVARYSITVGGKSYEMFNPELTVNDLKPDTQYNYTITAYNKRGLGSDDVTGRFKTEPVATVKQDEESLNVPLIAGVTAAAVLAVVIVVAVVVTLVVRKRRGNSKPPASETIENIDHNEIVCGSPTAPTPSTRAVMNRYMTMNIGGLRANDETDEMDGREYDYVTESQIDSWHDVTYQNIQPTNDAGNLDTQDLENVYNNDRNLNEQYVENVYNNVAYVSS
ncbi:unnamed protein product [Lymnaea stagnalis]|uniref:CUB domain-containing protein n=1 Tax=Lymnaea stagnalis TaxID=6523 RepID=A0AAV2IRH1_LYMST